MRENERRVEEVEALEARARRRDLLASEAARAAFFDARVPEDVVSGRHFDRWWKQARQTQPTLLDYPMEMLIEGDVAPNDRDRPARWISQALAGARAVLPLRPRLGGRRRHRPHPARVARGGAGDELRVARARVSHGARRRAVADPAQATAHAARSDPRHRDRAACRRHAALRPAARGARRGDRTAARRAHRRRRLVTRRSARAPADDLLRRGRGRDGARVGPVPRRAAR